MPDRGGTVGGAIAVGENDLCVLGRSAVRSAVLQVRYVSAEGRVITGGGPTVKNVTGFDLPRLMVGALGTIGLVAELILRTNPIPSASVWITSHDADPFAVRSVAYRPAVVLWDGVRTWIELEGHAADIAAEQRALDALGHWEPVEGPPPLPAHRWSLSPAELRSVPAQDTGAFVASIGVGTLFASRSRPDRAPIPQALHGLHRSIKAAFDPTDRLNPGRDPVRC